MGESGQGQRLLIIRFSSFGDIVQAATIPASFHALFPGARVDWLVRSDFAELLTAHPYIDRVIAFEKSTGLKGLLRLALRLSGTRYSHVYDAHNNLRSKVVVFVLCMGRLIRGGWPRLLTRPKHRIRRWLMFRFRLPVLPKPFRGAESYLRPLAKWGLESATVRGTSFWPACELSESVRHKVAKLPRPLIVLAPSAAWPMKRWPIEHWKELVLGFDRAGFAVLGGPEDTFLKELEQVAPGRVVDFAGRLGLSESAALMKEADLVIANDTGLLHVADQMERPTIALIGPTAFGYPSHVNSRTLEIELPCKPCSKDGRGRCRNSVYQRCLQELSPQAVQTAAAELLAGAKLR